MHRYAYEVVQSRGNANVQHKARPCNDVARRVSSQTFVSEAVEFVIAALSQSRPPPRARVGTQASSRRNTADSANLPGTDPICTRSNYLCTSSYPRKHLLKSAALHLLPQIRSGPSEHFLSCLVFFPFFPRLHSPFPLSLRLAPPTFPSSLLSNTHTHVHTHTHLSPRIAGLARH